MYMMKLELLVDRNFFSKYLVSKLSEACIVFMAKWNANIHVYNFEPGSCLNIKMLSYQYRDPHVKGKTVLRPSYL